jgi:hypothetical protein
MKLKLNRWISNIPAHTNQYFSGPPDDSIRHEGLYIDGNKNGLIHDWSPHPVLSEEEKESEKRRKGKCMGEREEKGVKEIERGKGKGKRKKGER